MGWDTGLLERVNRNVEALAAELQSRITPQDRAEWTKGTIEGWAMEGHRLGQTVAYRELDGQNPASITASYERQADPVILGSTGKGRREAGLPLEHSLEVKYLANVRRTSGVRTI